MLITINTEINAPITKVWNAWTQPESITKWNFATDQWHCPKAENNLEVGGQFSYNMQAKDGSMGFDFNGVYVEIISNKLIRFKMEDERLVCVEFIETPNCVKVVESFEAEDENSAEQQKQGWQSILNNFKLYVENQ